MLLWDRHEPANGKIRTATSILRQCNATPFKAVRLTKRQISCARYNVVSCGTGCAVTPVKSQWLFSTVQHMQGLVLSINVKRRRTGRRPLTKQIPTDQLAFDLCRKEATKTQKPHMQAACLVGPIQRSCWQTPLTPKTLVWHVIPILLVPLMLGTIWQPELKQRKASKMDRYCKSAAPAVMSTSCLPHATASPVM